jgi:5-methylcytosine-specific restriction endonuclease McrA
MSRFNKRYRIAHNEKRRTARYLPENVEKTRADGRRYEAQRRARKLNGWTDNHSAADLAAYFVEIGAHNCVYCGGPAEHIDHVVPLARGGAHAIGNLLPACAECNKSKGARDPYAFLAARFPGLAPLFAPYIGTLPLVDSFQ